MIACRPSLSPPRTTTRGPRPLRTPTLLLVAASMASLAACGERRPPPPRAAAAPREKVLATVNGVPITERDVAQRARQAVTGGGTGHEAPAEASAAGVLQTLVRDELISQQATRLGLDQEPGYRLRLEELEAQVRAFRRQELAVLYRQYAQQHAAVTDAEARAWFEENAPFVRTRLHVLQILYKGRPAELERDRQDVQRGTPFEEVAWRRFEGLPRTTPRPPWDLGELRWFQLPPSWRGVVDRLEPGQVSGIIRGEGDRSWVVKVAGKVQDPAVTFDTEKERIVELLRQRKAIELQDRLLAEAKARASITYSK